VLSGTVIAGKVKLQALCVSVILKRSSYLRQAINLTLDVETEFYSAL